MFYKVVLTIVNLPFKLIFPFKIYGIESLPQGKVVLAANHSSNADSVMVLLSLPKDGRTNAIAKEELFRNKFLGWFLKKMGAFPVNRGKIDLVAVKKCLSTLKEDKRLLIFPEGTRVKEESVAAKNGAILFAIKSKAPIVPIYITKKKRLFHKSKVIFGKPYYIEGDTKDSEFLALKAGEMMDKIYALGE